MMNDQKFLLSETQNHILSTLVCFKQGIEKKILYESIWPRDKNISDNKLDTHLTNLRNHFYEFTEQKLNFKTLKGSIKLDIN
jgi:DNA-binding winged helix-turn-helix (wHTH) protein